MQANKTPTFQRKQCIDCRVVYNDCSECYKAAGKVEFHVCWENNEKELAYGYKAKAKATCNHRFLHIGPAAETTTCICKAYEEYLYHFTSQAPTDSCTFCPMMWSVMPCHLARNHRCGAIIIA